MIAKKGCDEGSTRMSVVIIVVDSGWWYPMLVDANWSRPIFWQRMQLPMRGTITTNKSPWISMGNSVYTVDRFSSCWFVAEWPLFSPSMVPEKLCHVDHKLSPELPSSPFHWLVDMDTSAKEALTNYDVLTTVVVHKTNRGKYDKQQWIENTRLDRQHSHFDLDLMIWVMLGHGWLTTPKRDYSITFNSWFTGLHCKPELVGNVFFFHWKWIDLDMI